MIQLVSMARAFKLVYRAWSFCMTLTMFYYEIYGHVSMFFFEVWGLWPLVCLYLCLYVRNFLKHDPARNFGLIVMKFGEKLRIQVESWPLTFGRDCSKVKVTATSLMVQKIPIEKHWEILHKVWFPIFPPFLNLKLKCLLICCWVILV